MMSGVTPRAWAVKGSPSRPKPVIRPQALQVALGRRQDPRRTGHGLDDDGGDGLCAVQGDQPLDLVRLLSPMLRQSAGEGVALRVEGMGDVVCARQGEVGPTVIDEAAD